VAERRTALIAHPGAELYGSDRVMLETLGALVERDWRVVLAVPSDGPLVPEATALGAEVITVDVPVLRKAVLRPTALPGFLSGSIGAVRRIDELLRRLCPDVVYVSTLTIPLWIQRAHARRIPVLCHVHESAGQAPSFFQQAITWPLLLADRVVANSTFSLGSLTAVVPSLKRRATVVYNGVGGPASVRPPRSELADAVHIAYIGRLSPRKGVDVALDAAGILAASGIAVRVDLVGDVFPGYEWYREDLRAQARRLGLEDRVRFHGFRSAVWDTLAEADVAVVPSRLEETFGNTAVEAVLAARPVAVSAIGGLAEAIDGFASAIPVEPGDPVQLAEALHRIATDWDEYRERAVELAPVAARRFAPESYRRAISAEIEGLAGEHARDALLAS